MKDNWFIYVFGCGLLIYSVFNAIIMNDPMWKVFFIFGAMNIFFGAYLILKDSRKTEEEFGVD